jgi:hypothetical protein
MDSYKAKELAKSYERGLEGKSAPQGLLDSITTSIAESMGSDKEELDQGRQEAFEKGLQDRIFIDTLKK